MSEKESQKIISNVSGVTSSTKLTAEEWRALDKKMLELGIDPDSPFETYPKSEGVEKFMDAKTYWKEMNQRSEHRLAVEEFNKSYEYE